MPDCVFRLSALSRQKRWATFLDVAEGLVLHNPSKKAHVTSRAKRILFTNRTRARLYAGDRASWRGLDALFLVDGLMMKPRVDVPFGLECKCTQWRE